MKLESLKNILTNSEVKNVPLPNFILSVIWKLFFRLVASVSTQSDVEVETLNTELCVWILEIFHGDLKVSILGELVRLPELLYR